MAFTYNLSFCLVNDSVWRKAGGMNGSGEAKAAESAEEALARLGGAVGQPPRSMLDSAKALYAFISDGDDARSADAVPAARTAPADRMC